MSSASPLDCRWIKNICWMFGGFQSDTNPNSLRIWGSMDDLHLFNGGQFQLLQRPLPQRSQATYEIVYERFTQQVFVFEGNWNKDLPEQRSSYQTNPWSYTEIHFPKPNNQVGMESSLGSANSFVYLQGGWAQTQGTKPPRNTNWVIGSWACPGGICCSL